ncbi:MAG TPA: S1C family serine protease [Propionibacteriaceae bacterium]|nr:S1C family serine protease [Propionibacteriaceae bacterium]
MSEPHEESTSRQGPAFTPPDYGSQPGQGSQPGYGRSMFDGQTAWYGGQVPPYAEMPAAQPGQQPPYGQQAWYGQAGYEGQAAYRGQAGQYGQYGGWAPPTGAPAWTPGGATGPYPGGYASTPTPPPRRRRGAVVVLLAMIAAFALGVAGAEVGRYVGTSSPTVQTTTQPSDTAPQTVPSGGAGTAAPSTGSVDPSTVAAIIDPALVDIVSTFSYQQAQGAGTGIVLTSTGEVLTNNHVIAGATSISVTDVGNGKTYAASVLGYDAAHDVALIQLKGASGLKTASISSADVAVGQAVVGVGNAGGTGGTPTAAAGKVTALDQSITATNELTGTSEQLSGLIATDANIQSGDSGGALVDASGAVVGVDTAGSGSYSLSSQSGRGFAVPIAEAMSIAKAIEAGQGSATTHVGASAFLGVLMGSPSNGRPGRQSAGTGAVVGGVVTGDPAAKAGIVAGDTITSLGGKAVDSATTLGQLMIGYHPGDTVTIGWVDTSGTAHTAKVTLVSGPPA